VSETIREPRTAAAATVLLERFAELDGQIADIELGRQESIAAINARADTAANDLIGQRDAIRAKLAPFWAKHGAALTDAKRKSIELGGCLIGSRAGRPKLAIAGDEKDVVASLQGLRWAKPFLRVKTSIDRVALLKHLPGLGDDRRSALAELGVSRDEGEEAFFVERAEQGGTLGAKR
jgi:phage host-nuclease inhibitor protein Gam